MFDANFAGGDNGTALSDLYTATGTSETFTFDPHDTNDTLHLYAFANREAGVPEPSALALLALAPLAARRRTRRHQ